MTDQATKASVRGHVIGKCPLCRQKRKLECSHWIPRAVWATWKKRWSHGGLRAQPEVNNVVQDGPKRQLLCSECEQHIGVNENYAVNKFWRPLLDEDPKTWTGKRYEGPKLRLFAISLAWRHLFFGEEKHGIRKRLKRAERAWGQILKGRRPEGKPSYGEHYAFAQPWLLDDTVSEFPQLNEWWRGDVGAWPVALANPRRKFIAVHLPGMIFVSPANLAKPDRDSLEEARLRPKGGWVPPLDRAPEWFKSAVDEAANTKAEEAMPTSDAQTQRDRRRLERRLDEGDIPDCLVAAEYDQCRSELRRARALHD